VLINSNIETGEARGNDWKLHLGDSCQEIANIETGKVGLTVTSPPFGNLYIYSDAISDMGNCADNGEFIEHFRYLAREMLRVTMDGRLCVIHCKDLPLYMNRDGAAGLFDFPGSIIKMFGEEGWTYHSRVTIWKDPVIEMERTKNYGLLYCNLRANACVSRQGMADYLIVFRKWTAGVQEDSIRINAVTHTKDEFPLEQWQKWASPVWMDIQQTDVLNGRIARQDGDEKHICPLQLDLIERCIRMWSNPGDLILDPFNGIGSTGYEALKCERRYVGIELKRGYFDQSVKFFREAESNNLTLDLFVQPELIEA
jgi:DNA modification methylase